MLQRRIVNLLLSGQNLQQQDVSQLEAFLRDHFLHEYYSPLPFKQILPWVRIQEYTLNDSIFEQGDSIDAYYYLLSGRVLMGKQQRGSEEQRCLLDGPLILAQYFETHALKRQKTARVISPEATLLSINKQAFHQQLKQQLAEYTYIVHEISLFSSVSTESLEKIRLSPYVHIEKYRLKEKVRPKARTIYLIVEGQCKITNKRKEVVVSRFNCLSVQRYFDETASGYTYTSYSTELILIAIRYDAIEDLPLGFTEHISFIYQAHQLTLQPSQLPRLERQTNKEKADLSMQDCKERSSHKISKSSSLMEIDLGMSAEVNNFRKQFALGYYEKEAALSTQECEKRKKVREPRGYFQLKSLKLENEKSPLEMRRREWASYVQVKSEEKERSKKKFKGNLKVHKENKVSPSRKEATFKEIFSKYNNLPSLGCLSKKPSFKLAKSGGKARQFLFNAK